MVWEYYRTVRRVVDGDAIDALPFAKNFATSAKGGIHKTQVAK